jgi:putative membrane protein
MGEYFDLVADRFGLPRVPRLSRRDAEQQLSPLQLSFMSESRRLSNQRPRRNCGPGCAIPASRMASQRPARKGRSGADRQGSASLDGGQLVCRSVLPAAYLCQSGDGAPDSVAERDRLLLMAGKLYRFMTPIGILAVALGLWLWFGFGFSGGWLHAKTTLVAYCWRYHAYCGRLLRDFQAGRNQHRHVWYRWFNELPVLVLLAVTYLAVVKPF